jgi:hypothetical protein
MVLQRFLVLSFALFLSSCATQEYQQASRECAYEAFQKYPVNNVTQVVTVQRPVEVPTGETNCTTDYDYFLGRAKTNCRQVMRIEMRNFQESVINDTNYSARQNAINSCAAQKCYSRYGNTECKSVPSTNSNLKSSNCAAEAIAYAKRNPSEYDSIHKSSYASCMNR